MSVYATDLAQVLTTVRTALAERVGPGVTDPGSLLELGMVIEQLDNLIGRTAWDPAGVQHAAELTDQLIAALGLPGIDAAPDTAGLRRRRGVVEQKLRTTYTDGDADSIAATVAAVTMFSTIDIREQISVGMRKALPF